MAPKVVVIGNVDWTHYVSLQAVPEPGRRLVSSGVSEAPGATAAVIALQLVSLGARVELFTALGDDPTSSRLEEYFRVRDVRVFAERRPGSQTRSLALLDLGASERSLVALGQKRSPRLADRLPWDRLDGADAIVFTSGDAGLLTRARSATALLIVHALAAGVLASSELRAEILIGSARDEDEAPLLRQDALRAGLVIETLAEEGGRYLLESGRRGTWAARPLSRPAVDSYGCGACFVAGLAWGLVTGRGLEAAIELAAECGAACLTRPGPFGASSPS